MNTEKGLVGIQCRNSVEQMLCQYHAVVSISTRRRPRCCMPTRRERGRWGTFRKIQPKILFNSVDVAFILQFFPFALTKAFSL